MPVSDRVGLLLLISLLLLSGPLVDMRTAQPVETTQAEQAFKMPAVKPEKKTADNGLPMPRFSQLKPVSEKKRAFFEFLLPLVQAENQRLAALRQALVTLSEQQKPVSRKQRQWLRELASYYKIKGFRKKDQPPERIEDIPELIAKLLLRVDQVPPSLALAQAANESAWGTSRFARKGYNLFGQWCFRRGCGLVPNQRIEGKEHEVARFATPLHSVQRYIHNLNTNRAYRGFRNWRFQQRQEELQLSGEAAALLLSSYSSRGKAYVKELRAMIRHNDLAAYDVM